MDKIMAEIISDLFINLASGWIGAAIILPATTHTSKKINRFILTYNLIIATVILVVVFIIKTHV